MTSPPAATAASGTGGITSVESLVKAAHTLLDAAGVRMSPSKVRRLVRQYKRQVEQNGFAFFDFLANAVALSADQRRTMLADPAIARVISYADPTGETAVRNVLRGES